MNKKVLIAEDEIDQQKALSETIGEAGFSVIRAANGEEALKLIEKENPDLIMLDIRMPHLDGLEALKNLRHSGNKTPVVVLSNIDNPEYIEEIKKDEYSEYYCKTDHSLKEIVEIVCRRLN